MIFLKFIKNIFLFLLAFSLGVHSVKAKNNLFLSQTQVYFSIEQTKSFNPLEKEVQPNIGFLKEKNRFVVSEDVSAQNQHEFFEKNVSNLADAVGNTKFGKSFIKLILP